MIVYKVVRRKKGKLRSAMSRRTSYFRSGEYHDREVAQLTYAPGKVTYPEFGKIFAFKSQWAAEFFTKHALFYSDCPEIWEAWTPSAEHISLVASDYIAHYLQRMKQFWAGQEVSAITMLAPGGCVVCSELTLTRRLKVL